jgi:hypothetical protein
MPTYDLAADLGAFQSRPNAFLQQTVRAERPFSVPPNRWEEEVAIACVQRLGQTKDYLRPPAEP